MSLSNEVRPAISIRNVYKKYDGYVVLRALNLEVTEGVIYGLLGPSGCGKTTILHAIMGMIPLDGGEITSIARKKSDYGYMPQELALLENITMGENFIYFGKIFGLTAETIKKRGMFLRQMLDLYSQERLTRNLSGGQKRRLSLAVALLHDPKIVILDEPTVGVDPIISTSIWEYLQRISKEGKTVIITTHYIQEASKADQVGMMRNGKLLMEGHPKDLMETFRASNLEEVFLQLVQKCDAPDEEDDKRDEFPQDLTIFRNDVQSEKFAFHRFLALFWKYAVMTRNNLAVMMFVLIFPALTGIMLATLIGQNPRGLKIGIVNEEAPNCGNFRTNLGGCNFSTPMSCNFLHYLGKRHYNMIHYDTLKEAESSFYKNAVWAVIHFTDNYTVALEKRVNFDKNADASSDIEVQLDKSNKIIGDLMRSHIYSSGVEFLDHLFRNCGWAPELIKSPVRMTPTYGYFDEPFSHFVIPAFIVHFSFALPMIFTVGAMMMEKLSGVYVRSLVAANFRRNISYCDTNDGGSAPSVTTLEIGLSHMALQLLVCNLQMIFTLFAVYKFYEYPYEGNWLAAFVLFVSVEINATIIGILVATICKNEFVASFLAVGFILCIILTGSIIWPTESIHWILRPLAEITPLNVASSAFRYFSYKGTNLADFAFVKVLTAATAKITLWSLAAFLLLCYKCRKGTL